MKERQLREMPFDMAFYTQSGNEELCHATGIAVEFDHDPGNWWNEYVDSCGDYHYGR